ncbi:MAG: HigA family addiction module antitoxin [bacterium]|jgi:addiction module HigA family antidote
MIRIPEQREPTHPGEMLLEEFLIPMEISQQELADAIQTPYKNMNEIINKKTGVPPGIAVRLAKFFGMSETFWLNLQQRWDIYNIKKSEEEILQSIRTLKDLKGLR